MAVHHPATIVPTKPELLQAWVPQQPWVGAADASTATRLGSYRFDDPDGEVGMETHLLGAAPDTPPPRTRHRPGSRSSERGPAGRHHSC
ncbi:MAG: maltokinase N-terminal cap-like domain-containing protein [Angustibacter sp.]